MGRKLCRFSSLFLSAGRTDSGEADDDGRQAEWIRAEPTTTITYLRLLPETYLDHILPTQNVTEPNFLDLWKVSISHFSLPRARIKVNRPLRWQKRAGEPQNGPCTRTFPSKSFANRKIGPIFAPISAAHASVGQREVFIGKTFTKRYLRHSNFATLNRK